jgi:hypothetical protein
MKEELQGKLVEILTSIQTAAGKASDFAMAELPDIAQSYVAYGRAMSALSMAVGIATFLTGILMFKYAAKHDWGKHDSPFNYAGGPRWVALFMVAVGLISFGSSANTALLVWFAPKVWLLQEIASLLK